MSMTKFKIPDFEDDNKDGESAKFTSGSLFKSHRVEIQNNVLKSKSPSKVPSDTTAAALTTPVAVTSEPAVSSANSQSTKSFSAKSDKGDVDNIKKDNIPVGASTNTQEKPIFINDSTPSLPTQSNSDSPKKPVNASASLTISLRQRGNPIIKFIRNVPWEFGDIVPDYQMGKAMCALYLSLRYHQLNPTYIHERLKQLGRMYDLRVLLVQVDVNDPHHSLKELAKIAILSDVSLILAFSPEEAGRYLETYKAYENKPPDLIMEKTESNFLAQFTDCVTSTRKVNKTDAATLLTTFGSFQGLAEAGEEDLSLCTGFGPQKAKRLYDVLHEPFLKVNKKKKDDKSSAATSGSKVTSSPIKQYLSSDKATTDS